MKTIATCGLLLLLTCGLAQAQEFPMPQKEHELLNKFVGEWETETQSPEVPGQPAMKCRGTSVGRKLGGFWVVSDLNFEMMGTRVTAVQTIGYDPKSKKYVGTWVDSLMNHLWKYNGSVDESGKILTLEAEGPSFTGDDKLGKYRDIYEFKSSDHIVMTSQMLGDDGKWTTFMSGNLRRKK